MKLDNIRKIFLIGDLHLGIKNNSVEWLQIQRDFLLDFFIKEVDKDFDPARDILVFEGDIFHSRESINVRVQNEAYEIFETLAKKFKRGIFIILGNHDVYYKDKNEVNSLKSLSHLSDDIFVFEKPEILTVNGNHSLLMLPWVENSDGLSKIINDHRDLCDYIICHADIQGVRFNKWTKVEHGVEIKTLESYKRVYSGHIHHRQELKNIVYTGTPYQMDRGDRDNTKGFYVLDATGSDLTETFIENTASPIYKKFDAYELLDLSPVEITKLFNNAFVDIMISMKLVSNFSVSRFLDIIKDSHRKIEFFTYVDQDKEDSSGVDFNPEDNLNVFDIFRSYLKQKEYSTLFKTNLARKFVEIHKSVTQSSNE